MQPGNTPLHRLTDPPTGGATVLLKLEHHNPGGSIKDRTAYGMVTAAEREGRLEPGSHVIESSSGNTAIGLALLAQSRGHHVTTICDRHLPINKRKRLEALGANIVFLPKTPPGLDTVELRIAVANHLAATLPRAVTLGQYSNPANPDIHYRTTGPEIWEQLEGRVSAVVVAMGTCGTISGVGRFLKERSRDIRIIGVEPVGSVIFGGTPGRYLIQGGGLSFTPPILDRSVVDECHKISDEEAIGCIHELARRHGLLVGGTGGLVVSHARRLQRELPAGSTIVGIIPDSGERYLDTLFDDDWLAANHMPRVTAWQATTSARDAALVDALATLRCSLNDPRTPSTIGDTERLCRNLGVALEIE
jgi:cysteine synthase